MAGPRCPGAWCFRRCGSGAYTMRPYNEKGGRCVCRGGFHIRPYRPSIPATPRQTDQVIARRRGGLYGRPCRPPISNAPPPNAVGAAISRPNTPPIFNAPPPNAVGAAISRPNTPPILAAPPPSLVGRHAHMPPWSGRDAREPGASGGAVRAHIQCAPTTRRVAGASVGADFISARTGPRFAPHPRRTS